MTGISYELENIRKKLNSMINEKVNLTDEKIIEKSQELDNLINKYNALNEKIKNRKNTKPTK